jgi:hypothetical protein
MEIDTFPRVSPKILILLTYACKKNLMANKQTSFLSLVKLEKCESTAVNNPFLKKRNAEVRLYT